MKARVHRISGMRITQKRIFITLVIQGISLRSLLDVALSGAPAARAISRITICLTILFLSCTSEPGTTLDRIKANGVMQVATDATYPPFETVDPNGNIIGFDADLIQAVAERLGARVEFQVVPFDGILAGLKAGKYDAVISCLTITEDRAKQVLFSNPCAFLDQIP